ncbi:MAG: TraB/GumN family protein [Steroidobacteraceae bacterium]|jgi:uncharacterized protein YbaP (TraB family)|nr:TraB/GumN family protein [Steroidobacteraceae bacterium]
MTAFPATGSTAPARRARAIAIALLAILVLHGGRALGSETPPQPADPAATAATDEPLPEVSVVGERPGPGLWQVRSGERTLYVLGTLAPLPKKLEWRSRELEAVLDRAQLVIPGTLEVDADVGLFRAVRLYTKFRRLRKNPDGASLDALLPADSYARFEQLRSTYAPRDAGLAKLRPVIAAGELWRAAVDRSGLTADTGIDARVRKLAKARRVPVVETKVEIGDPSAALDELAAVSTAAEIACMDATLDRLVADVANARELAEAWSIGDVERLRGSQAATQRETCWSVLESSPTVVEARRKIETAWFAAIVDALERHETTLALVSIDDLLGADGLLARLQARGYEVVEP